MNVDINEDIISDLPDNILNLILSLIPIKSVIATSSVSKRWRRVSIEYLTYAKNLDFSEDFARKQTPEKYTESIFSILSINQSKKIDTLKLVFSPSNEKHKQDAINWIKFATSRHVKEIELDFCRHIYIHFLSMAHIVKNKTEAFELPSLLFDCISLQTVKLSRCMLSLPQNYTGFSRVTTVYLKEVYLKDEMLENLVLNCKFLEVLVLKECGSLSRIRIVSPVNLRILTVYECYNASVLEISGPNIRSLLISCGHLDSCKLENMFLLENVFIGTRGDEFGGIMYIFMEVLSSFEHVKSLTLYLGHLVPSLFKDFRVKFRNLQELMLVNSPLFGLFNTDVYCFFMHCSCPSLKKVTIELSTVSEEYNFIWEYRKPIVKRLEPVECVFNNLRDVTLLNFRGNSSDIELAIYFLKRAPILESMLLIKPRKLNVSCSTSKENESFTGAQNALRDMLLSDPMTSPTVDVRIVNDGSERNCLLSLFKLHLVSDVYCKVGPQSA